MQKRNLKIVALAAALLLFTLAARSMRVAIVDTKAAADIVVYKTDIRSQADLCVFWVSDPNLATRKGLWYREASQNVAQKTIFYTDNRFEADLTIHTVNDKNLAGKP